MTSETGQAFTEMKKYEYAIPARNETYRHALTVGVVFTAVVWLLFLLTEAVHNDSKSVGTLVWAIVAVVAVLGAEPFVKALLKQVKRGGSA